MIKIKTNQPILDLKKRPITDQKGEEVLTVGVAIANLLSARQTKFGPKKAWVLTKRFYEGDFVELDEADFDTLVSIIETNDFYTTLVLGQLLEYLSASKTQDTVSLRAATPREERLIKK